MDGAASFKVIINSIAHSMMGLTAGGVIDQFFMMDKSEDLFSSLAKTCTQSIVNAFVLSGIFSFHTTGEIDGGDPTGGCIITLVMFQASKNYRDRLEYLATIVGRRFKDVIGIPENPVIDDKPQDCA